MKTIDIYINEKLNLSTKYTCKPKNWNVLREIIRERLIQDKNANLNDIDVSGITDMSGLFIGLNPCNINISEWDVYNVKDMNHMFYRCDEFNSDLSNWDVSNVKDMVFMFSDCKKFNCDLNDWDVSNVTNMRYIFDGCISLKNKPDWYKE